MADSRHFFDMCGAAATVDFVGRPLPRIRADVLTFLDNLPRSPLLDARNREVAGEPRSPLFARSYQRDPATLLQRAISGAY